MFFQCFDTVVWVIWLIKSRPRYDLQYVWWDVKPCSIQSYKYAPCLSILCSVIGSCQTKAVWYQIWFYGLELGVAWLAWSADPVHTGPKGSNDLWMDQCKQCGQRSSGDSYGRRMSGGFSVHHVKVQRPKCASHEKIKSKLAKQLWTNYCYDLLM